MDLAASFFRTIDLAEELADRASFLSYAPAWEHLISVAPPEVRPGEEFEMAVPGDAYRRSTVELSANDIEALDQKPSEAAGIALRLFRKGVSADTPYQILANLWTSVEALATAEAAEAEIYIYDRCSCGQATRRGPASQQVIRKTFGEARTDKTEEQAVSAADETRRVRGKVAHGGRLENLQLRTQVENTLPLLQSAAAVGLVKAFRMKPKSPKCPCLGIPYLAFRMAAPESDTDTFQLAPGHFSIRAAISMLPDAYADGQIFQVELGMFLPVPIDPLAFPAVGAPRNVAE